MKNIIISALALLLVVGCSSQKESVNNESQAARQNERKERPSSEQLLFKLDANNDGKLEKSEVDGPLEREFATIDSNGDGFITKEELEKAPKPKRGKRPRNNK